MADRELPPLRVRLIGDDSSYKTMMDRAAKQADDLAKKVGAAGKKAAGGGKGGGFFNAQEQAIFDRLRLEERAALTLEKLTLRRMRLQEHIAKREEKRLFSQMQLSERAAKAEESRLVVLMQLEGKRAKREERRLFSQMQLAERASKAEEARLLALMQLSEKRAKREERRIFSQMQLAERAAKREEDRLFSQMQTWERIEKQKRAAARQESDRAERRLRTEESHVQRMAAARATQQRAADAAQQRSQQSAQAHQQRTAERQAAATRAADAAQQRSQQSAQAHQQRMRASQISINRQNAQALQRMQQSAQSHQQRMADRQQAAARANAAAQQRSQQSAQMHQQRMHASQSAINRQNAMAWQRLQQSQRRHAQQLFNSAVANRRANVAAMQRLAAGAATMQQRAARAAANLNNANAAAQQRLANAQMSQYRQNAQTQQRMHQAAQMHQARMARQAQILANGGRRGGAGGGGGMGLGGRADIYMGMHAIRNIMGAVAGPAQSAMDFQDAEISMTAYTGSAQKAADALKEVQQFALMSPYSSKVLIDNAKSMMSYGISSEKTLEMLKQLGNVAGGNAERMHLLSYAMAQVNSMGILQGQELRQLTESGFNPLMVMAKEMTNTEEEATKKFKELKEAMSEGRITAEMVGKALQNVTAKGGMFAGLLDKLNDSTRGLTNQFLEYADLIQRNLFAAIQDQLDEFLKTGVAYMKMISDMISQNKELAKSIAMWVWRAIVAVTAILALTVAMAALRWIIHTLIPIGYILMAVLRGIAFAATFAWSAFLTPAGLVIGAALAIGAAIAALIAYFYHPGGIIGAFGDMMTMAHSALFNTLGFFWNFGENVQVIFAWLGKNWFTLWNNIISIPQMYLQNVLTFWSNFGSNVGVVFSYIGALWSQLWTNMTAPVRVWLNNILGTIQDGMKVFDAAFTNREGMVKIAHEMLASRKARKEENAAISAGVGSLPEMGSFTSLTDGMVGLTSGMEELPPLPINTTLPSLEMPKYEDSNTPIPEKEIVDWEALMGKGKEGKGGKGGAASTDIAAAARGSSEAEQRARAFMAGNRNVTTGDPKAKREARMERFLKQIETNTRQPTAIPVATIV